MAQEYVGEPFQAFAIDLWDGSLAQVTAFVNTTGVTYPVLQDGSGVGTDYASGRDVSFVIDGNQIIRYRGSGFNGTAVRNAIDGALEDLSTGVDTPARREPFLLHPARPNPFNPATTIAWSLDDQIDAARVRIEIHDLRGRRLTTLVDESFAGGAEYDVAWRGTDDSGTPLNSGTYVVVLDVDGLQQARFLSLVK